MNLPVDFRITAVEIHPIANSVHKLNFPSSKVLQRNITSLTATECEDLGADVWTMSPPCQPFTRQGLKKDVGDSRCESFVHIMTKILPQMKIPPHYIFVENVKGFENSEARKLMTDTITSLGYQFREFLISPTDLGIPNSRTRYYLVAVQSIFPLKSDLTLGVPEFIDACQRCYEVFMGNDYRNLQAKCISEYLEQDVGPEYYLHQEELKYLPVMDVVNMYSKRSCCFTKGYSRLYQGTGSLIKLDNEQIRLFTPKEVCNLMCFPPKFKFPDEVTNRQRYKLLGNSVNVEVVSFVLKCMFLMRKN